MPRIALTVLAAGLLIAAGGSAAAADHPGIVVRYGFDADDPGHGPPLRVVGAGQLSRVPHGAGYAIGFPAGGTSVILEAASSPALNPGRMAFSYGASVLLPADRTSPGENVVQKGYATSAGGEWKLQVDGYPGQPSCVLVGAGARTRYVAWAGQSVADGQWHRLTCRRSGTRLSIEVDGTVAAETPIPADLAVDNGLPLRIGGKGAGADDDQFHGDVDDVFVERSG
jgi:Concanavalin A-like lectin/glucanases superfamily